SLLWATMLTLALMAGLLSKQMMLVFYPLAVASLITDPPSRALLKRPLLWLSFALSLLALVPPVAWNARHHWITAQHTMHHFAAPSWSLKSLGRVFEFLGSQLGLLTPVLAVLLVAALTVAILSWNRIGARERYLVWLSAPGLLVILLMSFRQRINANW